MGRLRGQIFSADAALACVLLITALVAGAVISSMLDSQADASEAGTRLSERASDALNQLVRTPGKPSGWHLLGTVDNATVNSLGLAYEPNVLDRGKVERFFNLTSTATGHEEARVLLAIREPGYNFTLSIYYTNGTAAYSTAARQPGEPMSVTAASERIALLNGVPVLARLLIWVEATP